MGSNPVDFKGLTFVAPADRLGRFAGVLGPRRDLLGDCRILEVGCGTGQEVFELAQALPAAHVVGVDISSGNIEIANAARSQAELRDRVAFISADYMDVNLGRFDCIVSDSTFHLMNLDSDSLFGKVVEDLNSCGLLVFSIPDACLYNWSLVGVRRCLRMLRSNLLDRFVLWIAMRLHHGDMSQEMLKQRVQYMYVIPDKYFSKRLVKRLETTHGLQHLSTTPLPHTSFAQPKHSISIFRKLR